MVSPVCSQKKKKVYGRPRKNEQQHDPRKKSASTQTNSSSTTTASRTSPHQHRRRGGRHILHPRPPTRTRKHAKYTNYAINVSDLPPLCVMVVGVVLDSRRCAERVWRSVLAIIIPTPFISRGRGPASGVVEGDSDLTHHP